MKSFSELFLLFFKGMGMGAANVIPGVSGGTIAFITGIYEDLIGSLRSLDLKAVRLLFTGKFKQFSDYINLPFLFVLFSGVAVSIISLAKLLEFLFEDYPVLVWAFFFGLILASIWFIGRTVKTWNIIVLFFLLLGAAIAIAISLFGQAMPNPAGWYVFICGIVAISSMILPGLSGSYILILMGNYMLVLGAVDELNIKILIPLAIGCIVGLVSFSHILAWVFAKFREPTVGLLTGFVLGSLAIIWPWKEAILLYDDSGELIIRDGIPKVAGYSWRLPEMFGGSLPENFGGETLIAIGLCVLGIIFIVLMEKMGTTKPGKTAIDSAI